MAASSNEPSEEARRSSSTPSAATMKLPQILRRGSSIESNEKSGGKDARKASGPESERKPSLSQLPQRLRRRKTYPLNEYTEEQLQAASRLSHLFFSLPSEIHSEILTNLSLHDILSLRQTSHTFNDVLCSNSSPLTRHILSTTLAPTTHYHIQTHLYPPPTPCLTLAPLLSTLHRQTTIDHQIYNLLSFVQMKIYMTRTATRVLSVSDNRSRLIVAFQRPAWFVTHFLEQYRCILIHSHPDHLATTTTPIPNCSSCPHCKSLARDIISTYPAEDILPAWHFYQLSVEHLQIATRAPISAGGLERRLRGWNKAPVTEEELAMFLVLGGVHELRKVAMMQGSYNSRLGAVMSFVKKVKDAVAVNSILDETRGNRTKRQSAVTGSESVLDLLAPPFNCITQEHLSSVPDIERFFYDIWKERIHELAVDKEDIVEPYSWLSRVMVGSGLEFGLSRTPEPPLALGATPV